MWCRVYSHSEHHVPGGAALPGETDPEHALLLLSRQPEASAPKMKNVDVECTCNMECEGTERPVVPDSVKIGFPRS